MNGKSSGVLTTCKGNPSCRAKPYRPFAKSHFPNGNEQGGDIHVSDTRLRSEDPARNGRFGKSFWQRV